MSDTEASESFEVERKYEVIGDRALPSPEAFLPLGLSTGTARSFALRASYVDTVGGALAAAGIAVRRREGGPDAGWHLKQRVAGGVRELHWPLSDDLPLELTALVREAVGDAAEVQPRASLRTTRRTLRLRDHTGNDVVELADDTVWARDEPTGVERAWHEWEAELVGPGSEALLDGVEAVLTAEGAFRSLSESKIGRAAGALVQRAVSAGATDARLAALAILDLADRLAASGRDVQGLRELAYAQETPSRLEA